MTAARTLCREGQNKSPTARPYRATSSMTDRYRHVRRVAAELLNQAFARLERERVLPRSRYEPWIYVGKEFEGWLIHGLAAHEQFNATLEASFPERFADGVGARDFAELYSSALVTAAVARLTQAHQPYDVRQSAAADTIRALVRYLSSDARRAVVAYALAGIQTSDGRDVRTKRLRVIPEGGRIDVQRELEDLIPGAGFGLQDADLFRVGLPTCLIVATADQPIASADPIYGAFSQAGAVARERVEGLLSSARLATNGTIHVLAYANGESGPFQLYRARVQPFPGDPVTDVSRVVTVDAGLIHRLSQLHAIWRTAVTTDEEIVPTLSIAVQRFNRSFGSAHWQERLIEVTIALEAALGQEDETAEVLLRLRTRAAALLADRADDAGQIFDDMGVIYELRSRVIHGSSQGARRLLARITRVPATASAPMPGIKAEVLIDRGLDLARRAILARLFLAQGTNPAWPLRGSKDLDKRLADDRERHHLRRLWHQGLRHLGLPAAASPATPPGVFGARQRE